MRIVSQDFEFSHINAQFDILVFFVSCGLFHGADSSVGWMFYNQSAVVLGNFVGGALVIGTMEHAMNHWVSPLPWEQGHAEGTLAGHDVESSRKANENRPAAELQQMKDLIRVRSKSFSHAPPTIRGPPITRVDSPPTV